MHFSRIILAMATTPRSSFIPKQVTSAIPKKVRRTRVFSIIGFVATVLLVASLLASGGVFLYKDISLRKLTDAVNELNKQEQKFSEEDIIKVHNFDKRIKIAEDLLNAHIVPSKILEALEITTKQSVQYDSFSYKRRPSGNAEVGLTGVTDEFSKVALQSMQYSKDLILKNSAVTQIGLNVTGGDSDGLSSGTLTRKSISFSIYSDISASEILYAGEVQPSTVSSETVPAVVEEESAVTPGSDTSADDSSVDETTTTNIQP